MGGFGSGRRAEKYLQTTDDLRALDVRWLQRNGFLKSPGKKTVGWYVNGRQEGRVGLVVSTRHVRLSYRYCRSGEAWRSVEYPVALEWLPCHYGGSRAWFRCPACNRRVALLYVAELFACRHCHKLAYTSQRECSEDRRIRQMEKYRERLGWEPGFLNGRGIKPPRMHWRTFNWLRTKHDRLEWEVVVQFEQRFGRDYDDMGPLPIEQAGL